MGKEVVILEMEWGSLPDTSTWEEIDKTSSSWLKSQNYIHSSCLCNKYPSIIVALSYQNRKNDIADTPKATKQQLSPVQ